MGFLINTFYKLSKENVVRSLNRARLAVSK
jgi:hypothetical protein